MSGHVILISMNSSWSPYTLAEGKPNIIKTGKGSNLKTHVCGASNYSCYTDSTKRSNLPIDSTAKSKFSCGICFLLDFGLPWSVTILTISEKQEPKN
jgi:hypothetical protein